jgi:hypothetical protein
MKMKELTKTQKDLLVLLKNTGSLKFVQEEAFFSNPTGKIFPYEIDLTQLEEGVEKRRQREEVYARAKSLIRLRIENYGIVTSEEGMEEFTAVIADRLNLQYHKNTKTYQTPTKVVLVSKEQPQKSTLDRIIENNGRITSVFSILGYKTPFFQRFSPKNICLIPPDKTSWANALITAGLIDEHIYGILTAYELNPKVWEKTTIKTQRGLEQLAHLLDTEKTHKQGMKTLDYYDTRKKELRKTLLETHPYLNKIIRAGSF